mmetsp:Transcript_18647/g.28375  ORF Transcript_18647/g.28375 Transcript_18647/m.28375 type:complete len:89 (+) Transcript_18647:252-518(+)
MSWKKKWKRKAFLFKHEETERGSRSICDVEDRNRISFYQTFVIVYCTTKSRNNILLCLNCAVRVYSSSFSLLPHCPNSDSIVPDMTEA